MPDLHACCLWGGGDRRLSGFGRVQSILFLIPKLSLLMSTCVRVTGRG